LGGETSKHKTTTPYALKELTTKKFKALAQDFYFPSLIYGFFSFVLYIDGY